MLKSDKITTNVIKYVRIICMNKEVVYIEPEDDITDIIARVKNAKQKLVALVPPKKIGVLRSAVNTKLIAKAARQAEKVAVIVTTDQALIKLAAAAGLPVAKTLQSRPKLPSEIIETEAAAVSGEQIIDENDFDEEPNSTSQTKSSTTNTPKSSTRESVSSKAKKPDQEISSDDLEKDDKKKSKKDKGNIPTFEKYRKWIIAGAAAFVVLVVFLVWAIVFAPAADVAVAIRTTTNNFSENVKFVTSAGSENPSEGIFLLEQKKVEKTSSVEFIATGQKDIGEKATGTLSVTATFSMSTADSHITVPAGSVFSYGEFQYTSASNLDFYLDGEQDDCTTAQLKNGTCTISATTKVTAVKSGTDYNIGPHDSNWSTPSDNITASNSAAFTGGTTNMVTVVSQSDFDKAKEKLENTSKEDGKSELSNQFGDDMIIIESSLEVNTSDPKSTPAVDEEVKSGVTPKVEATTTYALYAVDKTAVENYIKEKASKNLPADQKIYAVDKPFFENFVKDGNNYSAKLKSSTQTGPKVTEEDILEKSKGKKVGEVQSLLKSINGVSSVNIKTSFFWVKKVPDDPNKITIELKVEE